MLNPQPVAAVAKHYMHTIRLSMTRGVSSCTDMSISNAVSVIEEAVELAEQLPRTQHHRFQACLKQLMDTYSTQWCEIIMYTNK